MFRQLSISALVTVLSCSSLDLAYEDNDSQADTWGGDDRFEAGEVEFPGSLQAARATGAIFMSQPGELRPDATNFNALFPPTKTLRKYLESKFFGKEPCEHLRFLDVPHRQAQCGSALVLTTDTSSYMATAAHCLKYENTEYASLDDVCNHVTVVFDYAGAGLASNPSGSVDASQIYHCEEITHFSHENRPGAPKGDLALFRLDRPVNGRAPVPLQLQKPAPGEEVALLGFPTGLPLKVSLGSVAASLYTDKYLASIGAEAAPAAGEASPSSSHLIPVSLEAFPGNSGGPLFDMETGALLGVFSGFGRKSLVGKTIPSADLLGRQTSTEDAFYYDEARECVTAFDCADDDVICETYGLAMAITPLF